MNMKGFLGELDFEPGLGASWKTGFSLRFSLNSNINTWCWVNAVWVENCIFIVFFLMPWG